MALLYSFLAVFVWLFIGCTVIIMLDYQDKGIRAWLFNLEGIKYDFYLFFWPLVVIMWIHYKR